MNEQNPRGTELPHPLLARSLGQSPYDLGLLSQLEELKSMQIELELQVHELQAKQQESEILLQHYTSLFDWSPIRFVCLDHLGRIRQVNQAAATLLNDDRSRLLGGYLTQYIAREDRDKLRQLMRQARPDGPSAALTIQLKHQQGVYQFLARGLPRSNEAEPLCQVAILEPPLAVQHEASDAASVENAAARALLVVPDAVSQGHAQAQQFIAKLVKGLQVPQETLQEQVHLIRAWLEGLPEGIVLCDALGKILFINSSAAFLLADLIESTPVISTAADCWEEDLFYHADQQTPYTWEDFPVHRIMQGETVHQERLWASSAGGYDQKWLLFSGSPIRDHEGDLCGAAFMISQHEA